MLKLALSLLRNLLVHILELEVTIHKEQACYNDEYNWQEPERHTCCRTYFEDLLNGAFLAGYHHWHKGQGIERQGRNEPQHCAIDKCSEE